MVKARASLNQWTKRVLVAMATIVVLALAGTQLASNAIWGWGDSTPSILTIDERVHMDSVLDDFLKSPLRKHDFIVYRNGDIEEVVSQEGMIFTIAERNGARYQSHLERIVMRVSHFVRSDDSNYQETAVRFVRQE